jgi:DHA1 family bicyclomycin/chloramphenicol resistance-like MFS transporter
MGMAVAPMIAPTIGGVLETEYGWRASFAVLAAFGGLVLLFASWLLPETNPARNPVASVRTQVRGYAGLLRSRRFWGYALTTAFVSAVFFAFLAGAPYVTIEVMGRSPAEYGFDFAFVPSGYLVGNFVTGRFAGRWGANRLIVAGMLLVALSIAVAATAFAAGLVHPLALFAPMFLMGAGNGLVLPSGIAGAVSVKPELAGAAAGLSGSLQIGFGAMVAPVVGATLAATAWPLIAVMAACSTLAVVSFGLLAAWRDPPAA